MIDGIGLCDVLGGHQDLSLQHPMALLALAWLQLWLPLDS